MKINNTKVLKTKNGPKWIVFRSEPEYGTGTLDGNLVVNDYFPRYSYGHTAEDAVDNMFDDLFQPASLKDYLCVKLEGAATITARPRRNSLILAATYIEY